MSEELFYNRRILKILRQTGVRKSINRDLGRIANPPGKRVSKNGKVYWETRKNRTDVLNERA